MLETLQNVRYYVNKEKKVRISGKGELRMADSATREGYLIENYRYFHLHDTAGQELDFHYHDFDKLVFLLSGRVDYLVEDRSFSLAPGSVLLVKNRVIHKAVIDRTAPYERIIIYLRHGYFEGLVPGAEGMSVFGEDYSSDACYFLPDRSGGKELRRALLQCEAGQKDGRPGAGLLRDTYMIQLLVAVKRLSAGSRPLPAPAVSDGKIRDTLDYIGAHLSEELSVDFLAGRLYLSRYHFMRLFKSQTGESVHSYILQRRLLAAARLIREGRPVGLAAADCGFGDYSAFSRAFRSRFGVKPSELK